MIELNTVPVEQTSQKEPLTRKRAAIIRASLGINPGMTKVEIDEIKLETDN
jgi:hypothetical protein